MKISRGFARHGAHCTVISASDTGIMASSLASHRQWERMVLRIGRTRIQTHNDLCSTLSTLSSDLNARKKLSDNKTLLHLLSHFPFLSFFLSAPILKHWSRSSSNSHSDLSPCTGALPTNQDAHLWATCSQYAVERRSQNAFKVRPQCVRGTSWNFQWTWPNSCKGARKRTTNAKKLKW